MADDLTAELGEKLKAWHSVANAPAIPDTPKDWLVTELDRWFLVTARTAMPLLLAAVEAVLELAGKLDRVDNRLSEMGRESAPVGDLRREMAFSHAKVYEECADMIREAITRALNGENR